MGRESGGREGMPPPEAVIRALDDTICREIVLAIDEPMTVKEIANSVEVPLSTTYKKLDRLTDATLLEERTELRAGGHHRSRYVVSFDRIIVERTDRPAFEMEIDRIVSDPERQLVDMWSEVRRET